MVQAAGHRLHHHFIDLITMENGNCRVCLQTDNPKGEDITYREMLFLGSGPPEHTAGVQGNTGHSWEPSLEHTV